MEKPTKLQPFGMPLVTVEKGMPWNQHGFHETHTEQALPFDVRRGGRLVLSVQGPAFWYVRGISLAGVELMDGDPVPADCFAPSSFLTAAGEELPKLRFAGKKGHVLRVDLSVVRVDEPTRIAATWFFERD